MGERERTNYYHDDKVLRLKLICTLILGEISFFCLQNLSVTVAFAKGCLSLNNVSYFRHDHTLAQKYKEI